MKFDLSNTIISKNNLIKKQGYVLDLYNIINDNIIPFNFSTYYLFYINNTYYYANNNYPNLYAYLENNVTKELNFIKTNKFYYYNSEILVKNVDGSRFICLGDKTYYEDHAGNIYEVTQGITKDILYFEELQDNWFYENNKNLTIFNHKGRVFYLRHINEITSDLYEYIDNKWKFIKSLDINSEHFFRQYMWTDNKNILHCFEYIFNDKELIFEKTNINYNRLYRIYYDGYNNYTQNTNRDLLLFNSKTQLWEIITTTNFNIDFELCWFVERIPNPLNSLHNKYTLVNNSDFKYTINKKEKFNIIYNLTNCNITNKIDNIDVDNEYIFNIELEDRYFIEKDNISINYGDFEYDMLSKQLKIYNLNYDIIINITPTYIENKFVINLLNSKDEIIKLSKNITEYDFILGTLKNESSIISPKIYFEYNILPTFNYVYIDKFSRYYYVNNITSVRNNLWLMELKIDVLMSYKKGILNLSGYIKRNENNYNNFIEDKLVDYNYNKTIEIQENFRYYDVNFTPYINPTLKLKNVIVNVISDKPIGSGFQFEDSIQKLPSINQGSTGDYENSNIYIMSIGNLFRLSSEVIKDDTLSTYIKNIIILPFEMPLSYFRDSSGNKLTNKNNIQSTNVILIGNKSKDITIPGDNLWFGTNLGSFWRMHYSTINIPKANSYMDYKPYKTYELYIPYVSYVELNFEEVNNCQLDIYFNINMEDGSSFCYIYNTTKNYLIYSTSCNLGVNFSLSSTNNREVTNQRINQGLNLGIGTLTSAITIGGGLLTANPLGVVIGASQLGGTIAKSISGFNSIYDKGNVGINSGNSGLQLPQQCYLKITSVSKTNINEDFNKLYGKPLNEVKKINELTGFTLIDNIHIEGEEFDNATYQELEEIDNLLKNGIII